MNLQINCHNIDITDALEEHIKKKFDKLTKHFDHVIDARFTLTVEKINH